MKAPIKIYQMESGEFPNHYFNITRMETIYDNTKGKINEAHRHNYYTIVWHKTGKGYHQIDFKKYDFQTNEVYFVRPGQIHQIRTDERPEGTVITFSQDFLAHSNIQQRFIDNIKLFAPYNESPPLLLDTYSTKKLNSIVEALFECMGNESPFKDHALGANLKLFLIYCNALCVQNEDYGKDEQQSCIVADFKDLVEKYFKEKHKVKNYADLMYITPKHLNQVLKDLVGYTAKSYIQDRIITESKRLLLHTNYSVKEVGYQLGFKKPLQFSAFFKKETGEAPSDFRK